MIKYPSYDWFDWSFKSDRKLHKLKSDEKLLEYYSAELMKSHARWLRISVNGCNDPFYADGENMNLVRNHCIYYRKSIEKLCEINGFQLPSCYYEPLPPEVDRGFMASLNPTDENQIKRLERITESGTKCTNEMPDRNPYTFAQLSFI